MILPLPIIKDNSTKNLSIDMNKFKKIEEELESFLDNKKHLHTKAFAKDVMFSHELKANNQIEGYYDDVKLVKDIIERKKLDLDKEQTKRILNLYHGYNYILREKEIQKDTLKHLYSLLSKDLIDKKLEMNDYYRCNPVYILHRGNLDKYDLGINPDEIDKFMNIYFNFLNNYNLGDTDTFEFIKSQILHFYFVYIHPYYDVNGRTSRTTSMWYLLNKKAYPYIIFNRGIAFHNNKYEEAIIDAKKFQDISYFILFMLNTVKEELEKEFIMQNIQSNTIHKFTSVDYQTLLYLLSMNGIITIADFASMYNRFHDKQSIKYIYENMIVPLFDKDILNIVRNTNNILFDDIQNKIIEINPKVLDYDYSEIKKLVRYKKK